MNNYRDLFELSGRHAVVMGAGSGIGRIVAECLAAFGAPVLAADLNGEAAALTAESIRAAGGEARSLAVDMTDPQAVAALTEAHGGAHILVCSAAMHCRKGVMDFTEEDMDRVLNLNVKSALRLMRGFGQAMAARGRGSIITFSSIRARVHEPGTSLYGASKAAVASLVKALATEFGPHGVRVNAIAPSPVDTPMVASVKANPAWYDAYARKTVLRRWAQPHELLGPVMLLASDAGAFITGSELLVDGGWLAADGRFDPPLR